MNVIARVDRAWGEAECPWCGDLITLPGVTAGVPLEGQRVMLTFEGQVLHVCPER